MPCPKCGSCYFKFNWDNRVSHCEICGTVKKHIEPGEAHILAEYDSEARETLMREYDRKLHNNDLL